MFLHHRPIGPKTNREQLLTKLLGRKAVYEKIERIIRIEKNVHERLNQMLTRSVRVTLEKKAHPELDHAEQKVDILI